ncbi:hypothetical protein SAMN04489712_1101 [Thermomonospora echinospora]|uniref:Uncharacterized protein n=1 Tax=Thermomonospora echinospora TaxID=1992 RepID=A0A1H6CI64_9ACTN|nr:hypothetical protein [Thermomonospora echinospora]SEG72453.1 hypothetical protein SAMN04489712_1101 [Thermomonospora echinospora]
MVIPPPEESEPDAVILAVALAAVGIMALILLRLEASPQQVQMIGMEIITLVIGCLVAQLRRTED